MTLTLKKNRAAIGGMLLAVFSVCFPTFLQAQTSLALSVTPTLFEMSADRGQVWKSSVKVINSNPYPITVFANPVNFAPQGETGQGKLLPVFDELSDGATLAEWITLTQTSIEVPPETSKEISFVVRVPDDAPPGGHFAAILIGTQPPVHDKGRMQVRTSQVVTSLFFLRIEGDVIEDGAVRSFTTNESFVDVPEASFELRFENKGNVHLQPKGSIEIFNMWGNERGTIPINQQTNFGNVLPNSIRKFTLRWSGEQSFADIGRYRADIALGYGSDGRKFVTASTHFWVIPVKAGLITLGFVVLFMWFVSWAIKAYVRHMLAMAGVSSGRPRRHRTVVESDHDLNLSRYETISAPVRSGWSDLSYKLSAVPASLQKLKVIITFITSYRVFFGSVTVILLGLVLAIWFIGSATEDGRNYEVVIENQGTQLEFNSEEIAFAEQLKLTGLRNEADQSFNLYIQNTSGVVKTAALTGARLVADGYYVTELDSETDRLDKRTVIVFDAGLQEVALALSQTLNGALLSSSNKGTTTDPEITIFVGLDQVLE